MTPMRFAILVFLSLVVVACDKSQPSGVPETDSSNLAPPPPPTASVQPAPEQAAVAKVEAPPPLDDDIPPFAETGFPDCDSYIEEYRQCLNSRLGPDERKAAAHELTASVNAILGNIGRGVEPSRIASRCKKSRRLAAPKLEPYGCIMQTP